MRTIGLLLLLVGLGGCTTPSSVPGQPAYSPAAVEQPQRVDFFYGTVIDKRPVAVKSGNGGGAGIGLVPRPPLPAIGVGFVQEPNGVTDTLTLGPLGIYAEGAVPDAPAVEYTILLDRKIDPPDPFLNPAQRPAIVVVQNDYASDLPPRVGERALVRVIGRSGHVMRADQIPPGVERLVSAGPLPVPLGSPPAPAEAPCPVHLGMGGTPMTLCHPYYPPTIAVGMQ